MSENLINFIFGNNYTEEDWRFIFSPYGGNNDIQPHCGQPHCGQPHCGQPHCGQPIDNNDKINWFIFIIWLITFIFIGLPLLGIRKINPKKHHQHHIDKIKVAFVSVYNTQCGIATYNEDLMSELRKYVNVRVFAEYGKLRKEEDPSWVIRCWDRKEHPKKHLIQALKEWRPDIIHFSHEYGFFPQAYKFTSLISQLKSIGVPIVSTMHSVYDHLDKVVQESVPDHLIVHTLSAKVCLEKKGIPEENITVIPHGSNIMKGSFDKPELLEPLWNTWGSNYTIFQPGFLFSYKGHLRMLNVVAKLKDKYPDIQYIIQGSENPNTMEEHDALYKEIISQVQLLGLESNVTVNRGFIDKDILMSYIRTVKCCVLPYNNHPEHDVRATSGIARLIMATETPLVVSNVHLFDDIEGIISKVNDDSELYQEIDKIFNDAKIKQTQNKFKKEFLRKTNWDNIALKVVSIYNILLHR